MNMYYVQFFDHYTVILVSSWLDDEIWVLGMVDTSTSPAVGYMEVVPQRNAATLLPIIQSNTQPGTVIHSDQWRAYNQVNTLPNVASHSTVNHSIEFVDPVTGTHTQNVESYWNRVKIRFKKMKGCHESQLPDGWIHCHCAGLLLASKKSVQAMILSTAPCITK